MSPQPDRDADSGRYRRRLFVTVGERFGRWVVLDPETPAPPGKEPGRYALVRCDCGQVRASALRHLIDGASRSCGCRTREAAREQARSPSFIAGRRAWHLSAENRDNIRRVAVLPQTQARAAAAQRRPEFRAWVAARPRAPGGRFTALTGGQR